MSAGFYRAFEDRYRGSRETIKQRLRAYEPFIAPLAGLQTRPRALDVGCGRGEWLELLGEQGFAAHGVDLDDGMLAACRERGLDVELGDAIDCLRRLPDASLTLVSAFHLVEHIPFELLQTLVAEARRVLLPGGLLIMETPNAENLVVGATSFYLDPTHLRPLPPQLLAFVTEYGGFPRHKVVRLQEDAALRGDAPIGLINVLDGVSPDYAVVAQKDAPAPVLAPFEAAFAADYGLALGTMAQRFEQRLLDRDAALRHALAQLETHTIDSKVRVAGAESALHELAQALQGQAQGLQGLAQTVQAQAARLDAAEAFAQQASAQRHAAEQHIAALLASSSWRMTAPWRLAGRWAKGARAAVKPGLKGALLALARAALRRPRAKRAAVALLARVPSLRARLQAMLHHAAQSQTLPPEPPAPLGDMTPRAARVYHDLQTALKRRKH
ncbi:O-antigen chain-terminating methyltransferase [Duganella sp. 1411]|uniref:class I SAM-dependent methyltransferase n=1 Tax=Duganella sp. 1411 TaxID=2806572 RepID=UPI001AE482AF|nr:class I SAM-dependent methyltransferase [Duganella sp. 1411]MBP1206776.1 O-antigen chain-terminating methyltransferase [Duganella sp. 1411]